ncbi:MAG: ATP-binding protein [Bacteroidota bacterium]
MIAEEQINQQPETAVSSPSAMEGALNKIAEKWVGESLFVLLDSYKGFFKAAQTIFENNYNSIPDTYSSLGYGRTRKVAFRILEDLEIISQEFKELQISVIEQYLQLGVEKYVQELEAMVKRAPEHISMSFSEEDLRIHEDDPGKIKWNKRWKNFGKKLGIAAKEEVQYQVLLKAEINQVYLKNFLSYLKAIGTSSEEICSTFIDRMSDNLKQIELLHYPESTPRKQLKKGRKIIADNFETLNLLLEDFQKAYLKWLKEFHSIFQIRFHSDLHRPGLSKFVDLEDKEARSWESGISSYPANWCHNQHIFHNHINGSFELWKVQIHLSRVSDQIDNGVKTGFLAICDKSIQENKAYVNKLGALIEKEDWAKLSQMATGIEDMVFFQHENMIEEPMGSLRFVTERLPSSIELIPKENLEKFKSGRVDQIETLPIAMSSIVNFVVRTFYMNPIANYLQKLPDQLKRVGYEVQNSINLISLNLVDETDTDRDVFDKKRLGSVLRRSLQKLEKAQTHLDQIELDTRSFLEECEQKTRAELIPQELVDHAAQFDREIKGEERLEGLVWLLNVINNWFKKQFNILKALWTSTQDELDLVERESSTLPKENIYARLRGFVETVSPIDELEKLLPYYYRQLFLGRPSVRRAYLPGREKEMEQAADAARRMKNKVGGAILVLGDALSGKTTLCEHTAEYLFSGKVYRVNPPLNGSIQLKDFTHAFRQSIQGTGKIEQLIESTIHGSVFIFNDLELWWERSPKGFTVLNKLSQLIDAYGDEYYFIVNANIHAYNLISRMSNLSERFISSIRLTPMSRDNIRKIVLSRHYSSSLTFTLKGQDESLISNRKLNRLFRRYTDISSGNVGYAFLMWLANIQDFKQKSLQISEPKYLDMPALHDPDWLLLLYQILIHHRVNKESLKRIFRLKQLVEIEEVLTRMLRAGLIREHQGNAYTLNPFVYPYLIRQLSENKMI